MNNLLALSFRNIAFSLNVFLCTRLFFSGFDVHMEYVSRSILNRCGAMVTAIDIISKQHIGKMYTNNNKTSLDRHLAVINNTLFFLSLYNYKY